MVGASTTPLLAEMQPLNPSPRLLAWDPGLVGRAGMWQKSCCNAALMGLAWHLPFGCCHGYLIGCWGKLFLWQCCTGCALMRNCLRGSGGRSWSCEWLVRVSGTVGAWCWRSRQAAGACWVSALEPGSEAFLLQSSPVLTKHAGFPSGVWQRQYLKGPDLQSRQIVGILRWDAVDHWHGLPFDYSASVCFLLNIYELPNNQTTL